MYRFIVEEKEVIMGMNSVCLRRRGKDWYGVAGSGFFEGYF